MQSSPPMSEGKARAIRELSRSLSHSPRNITSPSPPPSDSNPTQRSGFGTNTSQFFDDPDILMSTQQNIAEDTNTLPGYPRIRSTAKKLNTWAPFRSEQIQPDTSMVNKEFGDFDHSISDEESMAIEQARGNRSNRGTPSKMSSQFDSLYDMTPPTNRSRKSHQAETGSLRRDAAIRRASRNDLDNTASPRPASKRNSPALSTKDSRKSTSLAQLHAKLSEDESSFMEHRPPTLTMESSKNTRWGNRSRQTSLQTDGNVDALPQSKATPRSWPATAQNATAQSFILPDIPNLTELVSGVFDDGTPVFSKTAPSRSRFAAPPYGGRRPSHIPIDSAPIPDEEKAIFAALQQLQEKIAEMEREREEKDKKIDEQELELIELRATTQAQEKLRRSDSAQDSDAGGKSGWKVEKTRLDATVQTLRTKLDRADRKYAVLEIEKKRLSTERDNMANQLGVAFQTCEELKTEKNALTNENDQLRQEIDTLRAENESLRDQLQQDLSHHREETIQLRQQFDQAANATQKENASLHAELARVRAQQDENTQQLTRRDMELRKARQEHAEYARLKSDHESLKAQVEELKKKREEDVKRWERQEESLRAKVGRRDDTIRLFEDMTTQERTNEAMRIDNENLRNELQELQAQQDEDNEEWARREAELQRKIRQREIAARKSRGENDTEHIFEDKPSYRREDTRTRIRNRVQQEVRNSKVCNQESPRKSFTGHSRFSTRSFSAPIPADQRVRAESDVESTTDLSLAPRATLRISRNPTSSARPATASTVQPPTDLSLTELSFFPQEEIARLRRELEEQRANERAGKTQTGEQARDDTVRSQRQTQTQIREDTARSVASAKSTHSRRPSLVRKSSLKDTTQRTATTHFDGDTGKLSHADAGAGADDAEAEPTQTRQSGISDASMLSNTSRRRRSAPATEMTSAFILPDIKLGSVGGTGSRAITKDHDNDNCTVCRREGYTTATTDLRVPQLVKVSERTKDEVDATLRPVQSPRSALALVVKGLNDERIHLLAELAVQQAMLSEHDPSAGARRRQRIEASVKDLMRRLQWVDEQIYRLHDVLEGQEEVTEQDVEEITQEIGVLQQQQQQQQEKEKKSVTIRSFVSEHEVDDGGDESVEFRRGSAGTAGAAGKGDVDSGDEEEGTHELPWEGFGDDGESLGMEGDVSFNALAGWRGVH
ncbi:hypothetical protein ACET3X_007868 [Alternaria dauci]|uniref:Cep57 centrosome microtubule-binding domain-containing protein n=1 Tax=Alternaria dauci TaxID=48095 RepID=A0ABR3UE33_9PLEO